MKFTPIPFLFLYIFTWFFLIISFISIKHKNSTWLLLILAIPLGGLFLSNTYNLAYPHIRNFTFNKSEPVIIRGVVTSFPQVRPNFSNFVLSAQELTWAGKIYPVCGRVQVRDFHKEDISYADQLILAGRLFRPYQEKNSRFSYRDYLESQGIYSILTVSKNKPIRYLGKSRVNPLKSLAPLEIFRYLTGIPRFLTRLAYKIRDKSQNVLFKYLKPTQAGIFSAMILGERSKVSPRLRRLFIQTGTVHILAISGLHVGIVAFILELFFKVLRLRRRRRYLTIILLLILYCLLTGARPSVIRATIMAMVLLVGFLSRKETQVSHSLALAALIILMVNPRQLFNLGFQLSFVSVISIVYLSPVVRRLFNADSRGYSARITADKNNPWSSAKQNPWLSAIKRFLTSAFSVSLAAWLGVLPFIAYYFKIISPVTVLANLVVVPYLALVIALGFSLLIIGIILPTLAPVFAAPANLSIVVLFQIIKLFNQIPWAYFYL